MLALQPARITGRQSRWSSGSVVRVASHASARSARPRSVKQLVEAHYRFPNPLQPGTRLTGSKSKKVIKLWQNEVAVQQVRRHVYILFGSHLNGRRFLSQNMLKAW